VDRWQGPGCDAASLVVLSLLALLVAGVPRFTCVSCDAAYATVLGLPLSLLLGLLAHLSRTCSAKQVIRQRIEGVLAHYAKMRGKNLQCEPKRNTEKPHTKHANLIIEVIEFEDTCRARERERESERQRETERERERERGKICNASLREKLKSPTPSMQT